MKNGFDEFIGSALDGADISEFERNKKAKNRHDYMGNRAYYFHFDVCFYCYNDDE